MKYPDKQYGVGLIEVLITVLILATSLLAMAALQTRSLQHNHSAFMRSQANIIAYDIIDRIRIASPAEPAALVIPGSAEIKNLAVGLPGGDATVDACPARICTVTITWSEQDATNEADGTTSFTYTTRL